MTVMMALIAKSVLVSLPSLVGARFGLWLADRPWGVGPYLIDEGIAGSSCSRCLRLVSGSRCDWCGR